MKINNRVYGGALALALFAAAVPIQCWADNAFKDNVPKALQYDLDETSAAKERAASSVHSVTTLLMQHGFTDLAPPTDVKNPMHLLDRIYATPEFGRTIFLKVNLKPTDNKYLRKMYEQDDAFLYHGRSARGTSYAVYLMSFTEAAARAMIDEIDQSIDGRATTMAPKPHKETIAGVSLLKYIWNLPLISLPLARADELCMAPLSAAGPMNTTCESSVLRGLKAARSVGADMVVVTAGCAWGLTEGPFSAAKDATYGTAKAIWHWKQTGPAIWRGMKFVKEHYSQIASIAGHYLSEHFQKDYLNLPPWAQGVAVCKLISKFATNAAIIGFTMGAGGAGVAEQVGQALQAMGKAGEISATLAEVGAKVAAAGVTIAESGKGVQVVEGAGTAAKALAATSAAVRTGTGAIVEATGGAIKVAAPVVEAVVQPVAAAPGIGKVVTKTGEVLENAGHNRGLKLAASAASKSARTAATKAARTLEELSDAYAANDPALVTKKYRELQELVEKAHEAARKAQAVGIERPTPVNIKLKGKTFAAERDAMDAADRARHMILGAADPASNNYMLSELGLSATKKLEAIAAQAVENGSSVPDLISRAQAAFKKASEQFLNISADALNHAYQVQGAGFPVDIDETRRLLLQGYNRAKEDLLAHFNTALEKIKTTAKGATAAEITNAEADAAKLAASQTVPLGPVQLGAAPVVGVIPAAGTTPAAGAAPAIVPAPVTGEKPVEFRPMNDHTANDISDLQILEELGGKNPVKRQALVNFLDKAAESGVDVNSQFIKDLNEIHLTGTARAQGLDPAKARLMAKFLKKYPQIQRTDLLKLAEKDIGVLGTDKTNVAIQEAVADTGYTSGYGNDFEALGYVRAAGRPGVIVFKKGSSTIEVPELTGSGIRPFDPDEKKKLAKALEEGGNYTHPDVAAIVPGAAAPLPSKKTPNPKEDTLAIAMAQIEIRDVVMQSGFGIYDFESLGYVRSVGRFGSVVFKKGSSTIELPRPIGKTGVHLSGAERAKLQNALENGGKYYYPD